MSAVQARQGAAIIAVTATLIGGVAAKEGLRLTPYRDVGGVLTVCWGQTGAHVIPGKTYTVGECMAMLTGAIERYGREVRACVGDQHMTQEVYEAATSLAYNVGSGAVCRGRIPDLLQSGDVAGACDAFLLYDKVRIAGVLQSCQDPRWNCRGVWVRRQVERAWCLGVPPPQVVPALGATG